MTLVQLVLLLKVSEVIQKYKKSKTIYKSLNLFVLRFYGPWGHVERGQFT